jgi:hypothetical protein
MKLYPNKMTNTKLTWGLNYYNTDHSIDGACTNPDCEMYVKPWNNLRFLEENACGIQRELSPSRKDAYALIIECPGCYTKYWFHVDEAFAKRINEERQKKS